MAVDTPAKIAIIGAGPIGLEAALYARYLGYDVEIFDRHPQPAGEIARLGSLRLYSTLPELTSSLGRAALQAQHEQPVIASDDEITTAALWHSGYLLPLAESDLLADQLRLGQIVRQIGKVEISRLDQPTGEYDRGAWDFRLLIEDGQSGAERIVTADIVFDCSGQTSQPLAAGQGGLAAAGEKRCAAHTWFSIPDFNRRDRLRFAGKEIVVTGDHPDVALSLAGLLKLKREEPETKVIWLTCRSAEDQPAGPLGQALATAPAALREMMETVQQAVSTGRIEWRSETWIEAMEMQTDERLALHFAGATEGMLTCDELLAHNGYRPDLLLTAELCVDADPVAEIDFATAPIITSEPNYYQLGARRLGRRSGFQFAHGLRDIRAAFAILADRLELDLYAKFGE